jgi:hypothetical protein
MATESRVDKQSEPGRPQSLDAVRRGDHPDDAFGPHEVASFRLLRGDPAAQLVPGQLLHVPIVLASAGLGFLLSFIIFAVVAAFAKPNGIGVAVGFLVVVVASLVSSWVGPRRWFAEKAIVGTDGVFLTKGSRFIPYSAIRDAPLRTLVPGEEGLGGVWLQLTTGELLALRTAQGTTTRGDDGRPHHEFVRYSSEHALASAIEQARVHFNSRVVDANEDALDRIAPLSLPMGGAYRTLAIDQGALMRIMRSDHARLSTRVASAVLLRRSGHPDALRELRSRGRSLANPRARVLLDELVAAPDDRIVEVLDQIRDAQV